jgi:hypothetical protein
MPLCQIQRITPKHFNEITFSWGDINLRDLFDSLRYRGFQKLAVKHVAFGLQEIVRSAFISLSLKELQKYIPEVQSSDISRY